MKKHKSVLALLTNSVIYKILIILLLLGVTQTALLYRVVQSASMPFYQIIDTWCLGLSFILAFCAITVTLFTGANSVNCYTLRRLNISERAVIGWQAAVNVACFLILWIFQLLVILGLFSVYMLHADPSTVNHQTLPLAFYKSVFMHALFPMLNVLGWVRNLIVLMSLGLCIAVSSYRIAGRKFKLYPIAVYLVVLCCWLLFCDILVANVSLSAQATNSSWLLIIEGVFIFLISLVYLLKSEVAYE